MKAKFCVEYPWVGGTTVCSRDLDHMTKMAATPIYGKNHSKIFFSRTGWPISTKLGMLHRGLQPIIFCANDDPRMTLTYFSARSILEMGKSENYGFFENYCSLRPEKWQMQTANGVDEGM